MNAAKMIRQRSERYWDLMKKWEDLDVPEEEAQQAWIEAKEIARKNMMSRLSRRVRSAKIDWVMV